VAHDTGSSTGAAVRAARNSTSRLIALLSAWWCAFTVSRPQSKAAIASVTSNSGREGAGHESALSVRLARTDQETRGVLARFAGSEAFAALIAREHEKWVRVVREAGIAVG
jgi:hypothetical protein